MDHQETRRRGIAAITQILIVVALALLAVPLIAMQFTSEVVWTPVDFIAAGALMGVAISSVELVTRRASYRRYRVLGYIAIAAAFLLIWAELAVGIFGD